MTSIPLIFSAGVLAVIAAAFLADLTARLIERRNP